MVLKQGLGAASVLFIISTGSAHAQRIDTTAPIIDLSADESENVGVRAGPLLIKPSGEMKLEYDSNIYALPSGAVDDFAAVATPRLEVRLDRDRTKVSLLSEATLRRFFNRSSENSTAGLVELKGSFQPDATNRLGAIASWRRSVEDRGDPEARNFIGIGPRLLDILSGELSLNHDGPRLQLGLRGNYNHIDYVSPIDRDRDVQIYSGRASLGYRVSGQLRGVVDVFATRRDFRPPPTASDFNRDATTYGVRAGIRMGETGIVRGEATVGVFRFSPDDSRLPSRTGVSVEASLAYLPTRRIAITLNGFRGDVATVRAGAQARTDTSVQLGVQVEARHNFHLQGSVFYRRTQYIGTAIAENTKGVRGEAEYRLNRLVSLAVSATYADRHSDDPTQRFDRLRTAFEVRMRF